MSKRAVITGQDGSYLAEVLFTQGYEGFGIVRRSSIGNCDRISHLAEQIRFLQADLLDQSSLIAALKAARPQEVYNLAAQSFVPTSWDQPVLIKRELGWNPEVSFAELVDMMVHHDVYRLNNGISAYAAVGAHN